MNSRIFAWSLSAALAGFLFGFDTVVISGAEKTIQELWQLSGFAHGLAMSMALWGTVLGALVGCFPSDYWGRKRTLASIGALYFISAVWSAMATDVVPFMLARFIGGVGVGISTVAAPMYISEIAPAKWRGRLAGMFQFNIVFGILIAFVSNHLLGRIGTDAWRWMLGVEAIPAIVYTVMCFGIPESPRWLIGRKGDLDAGIKILRKMQPAATEADIRELANSMQTVESKAASVSSFFTKKLAKPILLAFLIAMFNQLSGINAVLYFAPRIFRSAGFAEQAALLQSIGIGITNLAFTFVGLWLIDQLGRKTLLYIGSVGYICSLGGCAIAFYAEQFAAVPYFIFAFIAAHAVGQGAVIWVFISEIFPDRFRAFGQSLGSTTHWVFAAMLTLVFPILVERFKPEYLFAFFCSMMVLQLIWVATMVVETKGRSFEEIESDLG